MFIPKIAITPIQIETSCRRDIIFMWLLKGQKAPDHSTIARFHQKYLEDCIEDLFYQLLEES
jgi:transposase